MSESMEIETEIKIPVFDAAKQIKIRLNTPEGAKEVELRFPSDEELCERQRKRKVISKNLGRGMSQSKVPNAEVIEGEFLRKLRVDKNAVEIDDYEATFIVDQILEANVDDIQPEADGYRVFLRVPGGVVTEHLTKMPTAKQIVQYGRKFIEFLDGPLGQRIMTVNLAASGELYAEIHKESKGYAGTIPIHHKAEVIKAANEAVKSGLGVSDSETF